MECVVNCNRNSINGSLTDQRLQACNFWSACLRDTQVLSMEARTLDQTRWLVRPKICAANWAAASGERMVEHPRPARRQTRGPDERLLSSPCLWLCSLWDQLTARHAERRPHVLRSPVRSERRAIDDRIGGVSGHNGPEAVTPASYSHKNSRNAITCGKQPTSEYIFKKCRFQSINQRYLQRRKYTNRPPSRFVG